MQPAIANRQQAEALFQEYIAVAVQWTLQQAGGEPSAKENDGSWRPPSLRKPTRS